MSAISGISTVVMPVTNPPSNPTEVEESQSPQTETSPETSSQDGSQTTTTPETSASSDTNSSSGSDTSGNGPSAQTQTSTSSSEQSSNTAESSASPATKATAESQIVAKSEQFNVLSDLEISPERIEEQRSQELAAARELAEKYRETRAREEAMQAIGANGDEAENGKKMDLRIPLVDEIPDRPLPRADVPIS